MIPSYGTGFLPFFIATAPTPVPLPVPFVATYASQGGAAPIVTPVSTPALTVLAQGAAAADASYGVVANNARITVASLRRSGVYSALLVDAIELQGGTDGCFTLPESDTSACEVRPVSTFVSGA